MSNLLTNGDFEAWNGGTSFTNPSPGTTTADSWLYAGATTPGNYVIAREATVIHDGTYSLKATHDNNSGASAVNQDNASFASYANKKINLSGWARCDVGLGTIELRGSNLSSTGMTVPADSTWHQININYTMPASPTMMKVTLGGNGISTVYFDTFILVEVITTTKTESLGFSDSLIYVNHFLQKALAETVVFTANQIPIINHFIPVSISDSIVLIEDLVGRYTNRVLTDSVRLQEWLKIKRIRIQRWYN